MAECESAHLDISPSNALELRPDDYPGGIGIWGAVAPIYDTTRRPLEFGVHVHARNSTDASVKEIDDTFTSVSMTDQYDLFRARSVVITQASAVASYVSRYLGLPIKYLFCTFCGKVHLDAGYFATHPHKKHLCHACGRFFLDVEEGISNPIAYFRTLRPEFATDRAIVPAGRTIDLLQSHYPGGIQIWASNPALLWTSSKPEESGIHLHAFKEEAGHPAIDETYSVVTVDGVVLDVDQVAQLMAQKALPFLANKIVSLYCPKCAAPHFDKGAMGFKPHRDRNCAICGASFQASGRRKLVVSNPLLIVLDQLKQQPSWPPRVAALMIAPAALRYRYSFKIERFCDTP